MGAIPRVRMNFMAVVMAAALLLHGCTLIAATHSDTAGSSLDNEVTVSQEMLYDFENRVADIWGEENVWVPSSKIWVQYEDDLGERSAVDFEKGTVQLQLLVDTEEDPASEAVLAHMRQGVRNLVLGDPEDPVEMIAVLEAQKKIDKSAETLMQSVRKKQTYIIRQGDTLGSIAGQFDMSIDRLIALNRIDIERPLAIGYQLTVEKFASHNINQIWKKPSSTKDPLLLDQIRMADDRSVSYDNVADFANEVVTQKTMNAVQVIGVDGVKRKAVTVKFDLAPNHLEVRARKFYPLVKASADKYNVDPPLIMAMIHTESMFNPRARSHAPAYGLMQLVPNSGAREAYKKLYGKNRKPTSQYLYNPKNNIELGVAYFDILRNRYMKLIDDHASRTYCAVAAYNAGAANVGGAFAEKKSINLASPIINEMKPEEVYAHLVDEMHFEETRKYTQKVFTRRVVYSTW